MSETIADIVAEMRKRFEPYAKSESNDARYVAYLGYAEFADRIDEVTKCNQPEPVTNCNGLNAAKMREALEKINRIVWDKRRHTKEEVEAHRLATEALSAPPRNCDLYLTPKDAMLAHLEEVYEGEKVEFGDYEWCEFVKWLFAEAKEFTNK